MSIVDEDLVPSCPVIKALSKAVEALEEVNGDGIEIESGISPNSG
jgi:hypothetical protein